MSSLLAIVELGGYPNFTALYQRLGFDATFVNSQRKALGYLKKHVPDVIVAEYNFQSDFRDRTSNLETLMARLQGNAGTRVVVFYQPEHTHKFDLLRQRFPVAAALSFPITASAMETALLRMRAESEKDPIRR